VAPQVARARIPPQDGGRQEGPIMSLTVSPDLLEQARRGEIDDAAFAGCIRTSLPYAWQMISRLIEDLHTSGGEFADN
jgi:hypothetical protein